MANDRVQPRLPPIMHAYLEALLDLGSYGKDKTDVARTLIKDGVNKALADGVIKSLSAKDFEAKD